MQNYRNIEASDIVRDSRETINNNIKTAISCNSGTAFPVDDVEIGMLCYRTDKGALYQMTSLHTWTRIILDSAIDTSLSTSSANPVTNKAITTGINSVSTALSDFEDVVVDTYAKAADLATVATSGSYNDLSNKPTTNQVYQAVSTSTGIYYPTLTAQASAATGTLSKCSTVTVQPSSGNITCGTVNGVDVTTLAKSSDTYTKTEVDTAFGLAMPVGTVLHYAGSTAPNGWLVCDGSEVSKEEYAQLYADIGTAYGTATSSDNFVLPNLIDRFAQGSKTVGTQKEAGLPNITGSMSTTPVSSSIQDSTGAICCDGYVEGIKDVGFGSGALWKGTSFGIGFLSINASRSNSIYGNSDTVQPPSLTLLPIIKY